MATTHGQAVELTSRPGATSSSSEGLPTKETTTDVKIVNGEELLESQSGHAIATRSTYDDAQNMRRMGKDQQFIRRFRFMTVTSFTAIATAAWELGIFLISSGLVNGGRAGVIWSTLWSFVLFAPIYLSMAEMVTAAPLQTRAVQADFCTG